MVREGQEKGKVEAMVESEGELIELTAHLGKSNRSLIRGKLKLTKAPEVLEYLQNVVLRTPFSIVNSTSIVRQGKLDAGLFDTTAKRTDAFLRMAGLSDIEKKRQQLADCKAAVTVSMLSFSVAEAETKLKELNEYAAKVREEQKAIPTTDKTKLDACVAAVAMVEQMERASKELQAKETEEKELQAICIDAKHNLDLAKASHTRLRQQVNDEQAGSEQAKIRLAGLKRAQQDWLKKTQVQDNISQARRGLAELKDPGEYTGPNAADLSAIKTELATKIEALNETVKAFNKPVACCPTCRRNCTEQEAKAILAEATKERQELHQLYLDTKESLEVAAKAQAEWQRSAQAYTALKERYTTLLASLLGQAEDMKDLAEPVTNEEDQQLIKDYAQLVGGFSLAQTKLNEAAELFNAANTRLAALAAAIGELRKQKEVKLDLGTVISLDAAKAFVAEHERSQNKLHELMGILQGTAKQLKDEEARLAKLRQQAEEAKTLTAYCDHLEFARAALHRDNFPSGKVKAFVDSMLVSANEYLDAMQAGFSVSYSKDDGFIAFFPQDNKHMRADRLSGGEKVTFALAFRFAVNDLHTDTGFLILDEPTVWLDDKHIDYVISALNLVKAKLVPRVQLIIVTHDEKLAAVADSVFEVTKH
jgi:DNA repair exonuclease SbcCD ATPase subunit